ncbi:hypothetical protein RND81_03G128300 [Saponaria officinalis]|uniref:Transposase n=1 Tax=Saponaria officinalis TaxID=3572 RepID=A0AAW1M652_SAPOF
MESSSNKRKRLHSDSEGSASTCSMPPSETCDNSIDEMEHGNKQVKPLLPPLPLVSGRQYITGKRRAGYWVHFREYMENGVRRSKCLYCIKKIFASDGNKNGSKNIKNHWLVCPANPDAPVNKSKNRQSELVFDRSTDEGAGKLRGWTLNLDEVREAVVYIIIIDELPFRFVEKPGFKRLMYVTCHSFHIPSRVTITRDVYKLYLKEQKILFVFVRFIVIRGLEDKVFTLTVDNVSSNDVACLELKKIFQKKQNVVGKEEQESVNKVRYAVKFVKSYPSRLKYFKDVASRLDIQCELSLSLDVPTRWNSTFTMLETALKYKDAFGELNVPVNPIGNELGPDMDDVDEFGNVIESEIEHSGAPSDYDWTIVASLVVFLREFKVLTDQVSGSSFVTSNSSIFFIARALAQLNQWSNSEDVDFRIMAHAMKKKFDKYWGDFDKMNVLMYMGAILDPKVKLVGLKFTFTAIYGSPKDEELTEQVYSKAKVLFDEYMRLYASSTPQNDSSSRMEGSIFGQDDQLDFKKVIEKQVQKTRSDGGYAKSEFDRYLNEVLGEHELDCDVLTWWKLNGHRYPILARLARDVLAVPISTVASESTFSAGRRHLSPFRSSLTLR